MSKCKMSREKAKVIANLVISTTYLETQVGKLIQDGINILEISFLVLLGGGEPGAPDSSGGVYVRIQIFWNR